MFFRIHGEILRRSSLPLHASPILFRAKSPRCCINKKTSGVTIVDETNSEPLPSPKPSPVSMLKILKTTIFMLFMSIGWVLEMIPLKEMHVSSLFSCELFCFLNGHLAKCWAGHHGVQAKGEGMWPKFLWWDTSSHSVLWLMLGVREPPQTKLPDQIKSNKEVRRIWVCPPAFNSGKWRFAGIPQPKKWWRRIPLWNHETVWFTS